MGLRENVIEGLERLLHSGKMYDAHLVIDTCEAAIALLKALDVTPDELERLKKCRHECKIDCLLERYEAALPHLLTMAEITGDGECWLECRNGACGYADIYNCAVPGMVEAWRCFRQEPEYLHIGEFRTMWRCWSHKPTDEQREATPWD